MMTSGLQKLANKAITATLMMCLAFGCKDAKQTLYVYTWADYIDPDVIAKFETVHDCHVEIDTFDSNEAALAKLLAGANNYDVMFPTSYVIPTMRRNGLLSEIDANKLPNVMKNFDSKYQKFISNEGFKWSIPYAFGMTGIAWRSDKLHFDDELSWHVLDEGDGKRICLLDDMREMFGIALKLNGFSVNSTNKVELEKAVNAAIKWKANAMKLDNTQYRTGLVSGEMYVAIGYNSDVLQIKDENPSAHIEFKIPKEGSTCCFDEMVILKNGKSDLSHKFIDFLYDAEVAAQNCKYICSAMPNVAMKAHMEKEDLENELMFPSEDILKRLELTDEIDEALPMWNEFWDKFKAAN